MKTYRLILITIMLSLSNCTVSTPQATSVPIGFGGCDFPCWGGIIPGETTKSEAEVLLRERYGTEDVKWDRGLSLNWLSNSQVDSSGWGYIYFSNDIVSFVVVSINKPPITVQELIEVIGEPDSVRVTKDIQIECWQAELVYTSSNTIADLVFDGYTSVTREQIVAGFTLLSSEAMDESRYPGSHSCDVKWGGYRDYCIPLVEPQS